MSFTVFAKMYTLYGEWSANVSPKHKEEGIVLRCDRGMEPSIAPAENRKGNEVWN